MSTRATRKFKRDREGENDPVVQPELKPYTEVTRGGCTALSVAMGLVTEPVLTLEIEGEERDFMVDTGAMVSLIQPAVSKACVQPCDVQARGVTGTQLEILGEQEVEFILKDGNDWMSFKHKFVISPLGRCSSGILGMDFLQLVGAEISLTTQSLCIDRYSFPLRGRESEVSGVRRLINAEQTGPLSPDQEEKGVGLVEDWEGTVELAETVTVPPLSVRIARCCVIRRSDSMVKVPRDQNVLVEPGGLPGVYMARVVVKLQSNNNLPQGKSTSGYLSVCGQKKSSLVESVFSPFSKVNTCNTFVAGSDGDIAADVSSSNGEAGMGEHLSQMPEGGLSDTTTSQGDDLQASEEDSRPVENPGNQVDTKDDKIAKGGKGQFSGKCQKDNVANIENLAQKRTQNVGYVPIQVVNLSLEEIELPKRTYVGEASPLSNKDVVQKDVRINHVLKESKLEPQKFEEYLQEKLAHLKSAERRTLEPVLRKYKHLFYGLGSTQLGCTSQVEHSIETGDAKPIKRSPYRIPHTLKPVVDEHLDDMLQREIIEPSMSPWSSSIVLVQKKSRDNSVKYRFCIDYRALNAVTKPDAYPIPNIVDTLDSRSK